MFDDVCLVCGRSTDGLYCSDECRELDSPLKPPSSLDLAIDLGFITDSLPQLVSSARRAVQTDQSTASSPTSSILTTPSVLDDTEGITEIVPPTQAGHHHAVVGNGSTATLRHGTAVATHPHDLHLPFDSFAKGTHPNHPHHPQEHLRTGLHPTSVTNLQFVRRPGPTNLRTPRPAPNHRRTASYNPQSTQADPQTQFRHSPLTLTPPEGPPTRALPPRNQAHKPLTPSSGQGSAGPSSGTSSPALSATDSPSPRHEYALEGTDSASTSEDVGLVIPQNSKARKKRARASLPAYFSSLLCHSPPSTAISRGNHPPSMTADDSEADDVDGHRYSHPRSSGHSRTSSGSHFSPSTPKVKRNNSGTTIGQQSQNGTSLSLATIAPVPPAVESPVTPTSRPRRVADSLLNRSLAMRGTCITIRGRGDAGESANRPETSPDPRSSPSISPPHVSMHPRLVSPSRRPRSPSTGRHIRFEPQRPEVIRQTRPRSPPPPLALGNGAMMHNAYVSPLSSRYSTEDDRSGSRDRFGRAPFSNTSQYEAPQGKLRRYSSPQSTLGPTKPTFAAPMSFMLSPQLDRPKAGIRDWRNERPAVGRVTATIPALDDYIRLGGRPMQRERRTSGGAVGRVSLAISEVDTVSIQEEETRGRSRSRLRSRSRMRSRSRSRDRDRTRVLSPR